MKWIMFLLLSLSPMATWAQSPVSTPAPVATPLPHWNWAKVPWDDWFKKDVTATDKTDYVYYFWDAQDFKANFEVKDKKRRLAEAALEMAERLYPVGARADLIKVDVGYILEKDSYGLPRWDTLQKVAHFEFLKSKVSKLGEKTSRLTDAAERKLFDKIEIY